METNLLVLIIIAAAVVLIMLVNYRKVPPNIALVISGGIRRRYKVKDEDNQEEPNGTLHRAIVFLPMIRQRVKEVGGVENLTEFETFCYVLAYNPDDAILNMKRRMVNVAMEKYNEMREDGSLFSWAESVEFAQRAVQANLEEQTAEAEKSGLERGFKQGLQKGLDEGKRTLLQSLIVHKYGIEDEWVGSLSDQQMDDAVIQILDCDTYEALKERLKNKEMK